jgi:hypothetical protein
MASRTPDPQSHASRWRGGELTTMSSGTASRVIFRDATFAIAYRDPREPATTGMSFVRSEASARRAAAELQSAGYEITSVTPPPPARDRRF